MAFPLDDAKTLAASEATIIARKPDVVIINALRDALGRARENDPTDIANLLRPLGRRPKVITVASFFWIITDARA